MKGNVSSKADQNHTARRRSRRESGQIVIFMAFLLVFLVGMAGLAIDGGRLYFEYRDVQNATDAAIQAATYAKCTNRDIIPAAFQAVEDNGIEIDDGTTVWVFNPPITGEKEGDEDYVEVVVTSTIDPYFIQVVYDADLTVSARAVGICIPDKLADAFRGAMFAGAPSPCTGSCGNGLQVDGAEAEVVGDMHSNCDLKIEGCGAGCTINGDVSLVSPVGEWKDFKVDFVAGTPETNADPMPFPEYFDIEDYRPYNNAPWVLPGNVLGIFAAGAMDNPDHPYNDPSYPYDGTVGPMQYHVFDECSSDGDTMRQDWLEKYGLIDGDGDMAPGLYYSPCNVHFNNMGNMVGVTIVAEGTITVNGHDNLMTPYELTPALSLFSNYGGYDCTANSIKLSGSRTEWHGIMYAPYGGVDNSAANTEGYGALIGWVVQLSGSDTYIEWDDTLISPSPPQIGVAE